MSLACKITATKSRRGQTSSSSPDIWLSTCFIPSTWVPGWPLSRSRQWRSECLICKDEAFHPAAIAFQAEATPFPATFFTARGQASYPVTGWKALGSSSTGLPNGFIDFMVALQSAVTLSAALEWVFSSFGMVLTQLCKKLGLKKAEKLLFI